MTTTSIILIILFSVQSILWTGIAKIFSKDNYNNFEPRKFLENLNGKEKRAYWAHQNSNEAFPLFVTAIICANISNVNPSIIHITGGLILLSRIIYGLCYIYNQANVRSLVWSFGYFANFFLLIKCVL